MKNLILQNRNKIKRIGDDLFHLLFFFLILISASIIVVSIIFIIIKGVAPFVNEYPDGLRQDFGAFFVSSRWTYDGTGGMIFLTLTTLYVVLLSLVFSVPVSIFTSLFISRIAPKPIKIIIKSAIDLLASIPSVVFGLFGMGIISPIIKNFASIFGMQTFGGSSILSGALVIGIMSIPTITTLSISAIDSVDQSLINGSLALGASTAQTNTKIILKAAKSGIFAGIILGIGRALGEATAVQMVIGNGTNGLTFYNPFAIGSTLTTAMLSGIGEASGIGYDVRFSLGIVLMVVIVVTNFILNAIKNHNKETSKLRAIIKKIQTKIRRLNYSDK